MILLTKRTRHDAPTKPNKWGLEPLMSQREVARRMGISHGLVALIERQAFAKLRAAFKADGAPQ